MVLKRYKILADQQDSKSLIAVDNTTNSDNAPQMSLDIDGELPLAIALHQEVDLFVSCHSGHAKRCCKFILSEINSNSVVFERSTRQDLKHTMVIQTAYHPEVAPLTIISLNGRNDCQFTTSNNQFRIITKPDRSLVVKQSHKTLIAIFHEGVLSCKNGEEGIIEFIEEPSHDETASHSSTNTHSQVTDASTIEQSISADTSCKDQQTDPLYCVLLMLNSVTYSASLNKETLEVFCNTDQSPRTTGFFSGMCRVLSQRPLIDALAPIGDTKKDKSGNTYVLFQRIRSDAGDKKSLSSVWLKLTDIDRVCREKSSEMLVGHENNDLGLGNEIQLRFKNGGIDSVDPMPRPFYETLAKYSAMR